MATNSAVLDEHLRYLSVAYAVSVTERDEWIQVNNFRLPPGYNAFTTEILVEVPVDYPLSPPGVGARVYVRPNLRFRGRKLRDVHPGTTPGWGDWAWLCYQWIRWDPHVDDLVSFMEMVRTDLTDPPTH